MLDQHMHSAHSFDGQAPVRELCARAVTLGLAGIAITDHIDQVATPALFPDFTPDKLAATARGSSADTLAARSEFAGQLQVLRGVELGQALHNRALSEFLLHTYDYDVVIGSIHNLRATDDFYFMHYQSTQQAHDLLRQYFDELLDLLRWGDFDILAHLTYPLRYMVGRDGIPVELSLFSAQIDEILTLVAQSGKALEINCSGLRQEIGDTLPGEDIVRHFRGLGGQYITLGSDAHRTKDVGFGLDTGAQIAQRCGFETLTVFQNRQPTQVPFGTWTGQKWTV
ncbi:MAG: histidinol-phosphatase HisJ family protein [Oscillospiraceae bacterium]|jgi:histidinol-phosphatase (PHP family)|nr:histidinol-phosphatase HisJ family protein [Oscillospiraceae bacterium]